MDYKILIPSLGRCGSTLVSDSIAAALHTKVHFVPDYRIAPKKWVLKTHVPYRGAPDYDYCAVFLWGNVGDIIASLYQMRTSWGSDKIDGLRLHLKHLDVWTERADYFFMRLERDYDDAFAYLIAGDKLNFCFNYLSWGAAPNTRAIKYEHLCAYPTETFDEISDFIGTHVPPPEIKPRQSSIAQLPKRLQNLIRENYPDWMLK
jgi:hypothetical protein